MEKNTNIGAWSIVGSLSKSIVDVNETFDDKDFINFESTNLEKRLENCTTPEEKRSEYNTSAERVADVKKRVTLCETTLRGMKMLCITGICAGALVTINKIAKGK